MIGLVGVKFAYKLHPVHFLELYMNMFRLNLNFRFLLKTNLPKENYIINTYIFTGRIRLRRKKYLDWILTTEI